MGWLKVRELIWSIFSVIVVIVLFKLIRLERDCEVLKLDTGELLHRVKEGDTFKFYDEKDCPYCNEEY